MNRLTTKSVSNTHKHTHKVLKKSHVGNRNLSLLANLTRHIRRLNQEGVTWECITRRIAGDMNMITNSLIIMFLTRSIYLAVVSKIAISSNNGGGRITLHITWEHLEKRGKLITAAIRVPVADNLNTIKRTLNILNIIGMLHKTIREFLKIMVNSLNRLPELNACILLSLKILQNILLHLLTILVAGIVSNTLILIILVLTAVVKKRILLLAIKVIEIIGIFILNVLNRLADRSGKKLLVVLTIFIHILRCLTKIAANLRNTEIVVEHGYGLTNCRRGLVNIHTPLKGLRHLCTTINFILMLSRTKLSSNNVSVSVNGLNKRGNSTLNVLELIGNLAIRRHLRERLRITLKHAKLTKITLAHFLAYRVIVITGKSEIRMTAADVAELCE